MFACMEESMAKEQHRKWIVVGAVIYGLTFLNGFRFIHQLPTWAVVVGSGVSLFMFVGFLTAYKLSSK